MTTNTDSLAVDRPKTDDLGSGMLWLVNVSTLSEVTRRDKLRTLAVAARRVTFDRAV